MVRHAPTVAGMLHLPYEDRAIHRVTRRFTGLGEGLSACAKLGEPPATFDASVGLETRSRTVPSAAQ